MDEDADRRWPDRWGSGIGRPAQPWAIVLAAGEGRRLRALSRDSCGESLPKQYWRIHGDTTMLDWTIDRASWFTGRLRIVPVVAAHHRQWWQVALRNIPARNIAVQPENRGTAIGILFPLLRIFSRDPGATVIILPTDHFVEREAVFQAAMERAIDELRDWPMSPILLGITPSRPDPDLGYIVPVPGAATLSSVGGFIEKPDISSARRLVEEGALWNSFVLVSRVSALVRLFQRTHPSIIKAFLAIPGSGEWTEHAVRSLYAELPELDFSRDILQKAASSFRVIAVPECGWTDLGTPARVEIWRERVVTSPVW